MTRDQTIALAGLYQSLALVQDFARSGDTDDDDAFSACIQSVLHIDASSAADVYHGLANLRLGLKTVIPHLQRKMNHDRLEQARYAANLMFLERRLHAEPKVAAALHGELVRLAAMPGRTDNDRDALIDALARAYQDHVSPLGPKVLVSGAPVHLKHESTAARIRALLLSGLRAVVLWRHSDGSRLRLLLARSNLARVAQSLLEGLPD